ncbi:small ribosomal subunit protein uS3mA-like [Amphiura filiformis]|uniref:small ribosomal subunit protein uS3mA-like n=1 Tax=Amphiura filiformis TaxID=82378 RepID=UPI003B220041
MAAYTVKCASLVPKSSCRFHRIFQACLPSTANGTYLLSSQLPKRCLQTTAVCHKTVAGRIKRSKGEKPVMYEEINPPFTIGVTKGWTSQHTANLEGEDYKAERILEDMFIRRFLFGTFHNLIVSEVVIKRRANQIILACMMLRSLPPKQYYFLIGYTEELLSYWYKSPVKMEIQLVLDKPIYKWI